MADGTKIEWADATLNYVNGCSLESPGCTNCYAMKQAHRFPVRQGLTTKTKGGMVWTGEVRENPRALEQALAWKRGRAIFWNAHGDLFHRSVPDEWIDRQFAVMALTPQHRHMVLTKRSARMREYLTAPGWAARVSDIVNAWPSEKLGHGNEYIADCRLLLGDALPNVWLGVSVEDQQRANERIPDLLATPAAVRFISAEPLLGPVDLRQWMHDYGCSACGYGGPVHLRCRECDWQGSPSEAVEGEECPGCAAPLADYYACPQCGEPDGEGDFGPTISGHRLGLLDWVIAGGESGPGARPMHPDWARSLRDQCTAVGVAFHFKQWGEWVSTYDRDVEDPDWRRSNAVQEQGGHGGRWLNLAGGHGFHGERVQYVARVGKKRAGRLLDGVEHNGAPA